MATEINTSSPLMMFFSTLTTGACILFGHLVATYNNIHLPPIVIESMQFLSYTGGTIVACLTIYKFCKERKKNKTNDKSKKA